MARAKSAKKRKKKSKDGLLIGIVVVAIIAVIGGVGLYLMGGKLIGGLPDLIAKKEVVNPLTGQICAGELAARPLVVSIDNVGDAVPQSWLSKADLVYEFPVEGNQTRLQAVYYGEFPEAFGPVRSTRPYFVDLTREYQAIFLAHGWSPQAKEYLLSDVVPYINAMNSDCSFYRVNDKSAPHNSYIKWEEVKAEIDRKGWWDEPKKIKPFRFLGGGQANEGESAANIAFNYSNSKCEFVYDSASGKYTRTINGGKSYVDHETGEPITVDNILVQKVESSRIDSYGRLRIDMCAGGDAVLLTNGVAVKGRWSRDSLDSRTVFTDEKGNEFRLVPGQSWVEVIDQNCTFTYN